MRILPVTLAALVGTVVVVAPTLAADTSGKLKSIDEQKRELVLEDGRIFEICTCTQLDAFRTVKPGDNVIVLFYPNTNISTGILKE